MKGLIVFGEGNPWRHTQAAKQEAASLQLDIAVASLALPDVAVVEPAPLPAMASSPTIHDLAQLSVAELATMVAARNRITTTSAGDSDDCQIVSIHTNAVDLTAESDDEYFDCKPWEDRAYSQDCYQEELLIDEAGKPVKQDDVEVPWPVQQLLASLSRQSPAAVAKALLGSHDAGIVDPAPLPIAVASEPDDGDEAAAPEKTPAAKGPEQAPPRVAEPPAALEEAPPTKAPPVSEPLADPEELPLVPVPIDKHNKKRQLPASFFSPEEPPAKVEKVVKTLHGKRRPQDPVKGAKFDEDLAEWLRAKAAGKHKRSKLATEAFVPQGPPNACCEKCNARQMTDFADLFVEDKMPQGDSAEFIKALPKQFWPHVKIESGSTQKVAAKNSYIVRAPCGSRVEIHFAKRWVRLDVSCSGYDRWCVIGGGSRNLVQGDDETSDAFFVRISGLICDCKLGCFCA